MSHKKAWKALAAVTAASIVTCGFYTFQNSVVARNRLWKKGERKEPDPGTPEGKVYYTRKKAKEHMKAQPFEDVYINSFDGLRLHGLFLPNENAQRIAILCHGFHGSPASDFCFIFPMLEKDCTILAIDERSQGESEGTFITFGAREKLDIKEWARWVNAHNPGHLPVYLFGVSMGASAVLMTADDASTGVSGIIADCGYTSMNSIIKDVQKKWYKVSLSGVRLALDGWCRGLAGFRMKDASALESMANAKIPVLFFHGEKDDFVLPKHTIKNAEACASEHETVLIPEAAHAACSSADPELYEKKLREFFAKHDA